MKRAGTWTLFAVILVATLVFTPLVVAQEGGQSGGDNETNVGITVEAPVEGVAGITEILVKDLDLVVSPNPGTVTDYVTLTVEVNQATTRVGIYAEISNKSQLKIKWYNLLENGHFFINGISGWPGAKGNSWDFGEVAFLEPTTAADLGPQTFEIPITVDLSAGGTVDKKGIPAGSTGKAAIVWTVVIDI